jgi:hypothetical protein
MYQACTCQLCVYEALRSLQWRGLESRSILRSAVTAVAGTSCSVALEYLYANTVAVLITSYALCSYNFFDCTS